MKEFLSGIMGGFIVVGILFVIIFFTYPFNYHYSIVKNNIYLINPSKKDSLIKYTEQAKIIKELENDHIILTPQEYTSNILTYYNTFLTILIAMLLIFSFISYLHLRFLSEKEISDVFRKKLDSGEFEDILFGKAEERFVSSESLNEVMAGINNKADNEIINDILERLDDLENKNGPEILEKPDEEDKS
ncbi:hypothetical protein [Clostridium sp.]|uniref:hypothetical protein n=1 Tax=Clostridium sp. TaxID=1506 RepID=UPI00284DE21A|nr:hypothetical protein [Clostridium sp.]MDR3596875.1 hypothetical protein [Clostridium sp.]